MSFRKRQYVTQFTCFQDLQWWLICCTAWKSTKLSPCFKHLERPSAHSVHSQLLNTVRNLQMAMMGVVRSNDWSYIVAMEYEAYFKIWLNIYGTFWSSEFDLLRPSKKRLCFLPMLFRKYWSQYWPYDILKRSLNTSVLKNKAFKGRFLQWCHRITIFWDKFSVNSS